MCKAYTSGEGVRLKLMFFFVAYLPEWSLHKKYVALTLDTKNFLVCQIKVQLYFLDYNKFIGFYASNMIPRKRVMWKFPKKILKCT